MGASAPGDDGDPALTKSSGPRHPESRTSFALAIDDRQPHSGPLACSRPRQRRALRIGRPNRQNLAPRTLHPRSSHFVLDHLGANCRLMCSRYLTSRRGRVPMCQSGATRLAVSGEWKPRGPHFSRPHLGLFGISPARRVPIGLASGSSVAVGSGDFHISPEPMAISKPD